jgi:hypothetical protein
MPLLEIIQKPRHADAMIRFTATTISLVGMKQATGDTTDVSVPSARSVSCESHCFYGVLTFPAEKSFNAKDDSKKHRSSSEIAPNEYHDRSSPMWQKISWRQRAWFVNCKSAVYSRDTPVSKPIEKAKDNEAQGMRNTPFHREQPEIPRHNREAPGIERHSCKSEVHGLYHQCC